MAVEIDAANKYRQVIGELLGAYKELLSINEEFVKIGLPGSLTDSQLGDITVVQFTDGVTAAQAVMTTIDTNGTNLYIASDGSQR